MIAWYIARMLYYTRDEDECAEIANWILENYPKEVEPCAAALVILGELRMTMHNKPDEGEPYFRRLADEYGESDEAPAALNRLANAYLRKKNIAKAKALGDEIRAKWSESWWSRQAYETLTASNAITKVHGAPSPMTEDERKWEELRPLHSGVRSQIPEGLKVAHLKEYCGPWAYYRACQKLSKPCTPTEAFQHCGLGSQGSWSFGDLVNAFESTGGLEVTAQEMGHEQLGQLATPGDRSLILHMNNHYMVLESSDASGVVLSDAQGSAQRMTWERLRIHWDGYVLNAGAAIAPAVGQ